MKSPLFSPAELAAAFPGWTGFRFMASGSYKTVYRMSQNGSSREEVLKIVRLPIDRASEELEAIYQQELGRLQRETDILARCGSPFVVKLGTLSPTTKEVANCPCFTYSEELLPGADLSDMIRSSQDVLPSEQQVKELMRCLVSAIQSLWRDHRLVHRDIKPANIFATRIPDRPFVLIDLGIAYDVSAPGLTVNQSAIPHTPLYTAPEMLTSGFRETMSYRSDLYAAGLSAFEFATGIHPLAKTGDDLRKTYTRVIHQEPRLLESLRSDLSPSLCRLINQLLKKSPSLRPANLNLILSQLA